MGLHLVHCQAEREPRALRYDGSQKHPDGVTMLRWKDGKQIAWDYTCASKLADIYLPYSEVEGGEAPHFQGDPEDQQIQRAATML